MPEKCPNCGLIEGHANHCFVDVLYSDLVVLRRCKEALEEIEAARKSWHGITLSEAMAIVSKGLHGPQRKCPCCDEPRTCALHVYLLSDKMCECNCGQSSTEKKA